MFISKLRTGAVSKKKAVSVDTIFVAINKRIYTNINEGNEAKQWEALQVLLHMWSYDFYDMGYFIE